MTAPLLTGLMPVKDVSRDWWLRVAINGAAGQSYDPFQLIICDNNSTRASTLTILDEAEDRFKDRIVRVKEQREGTAYALDACLKAADDKTQFFTKFDADDYFHRDRERARMRLFVTLPPQVTLVYDSFLQLNYAPRPHVQSIILPPYDYRRHVQDSFIHGNSCWRASVFERWGGPLKETFVYDGYATTKANKHGEDYAMWLNILDFSDAFHLNNDPAHSWVYRAYADSKYHRDRKGVDYARTLLQRRAKERRGLT